MPIRRRASFGVCGVTGIVDETVSEHDGEPNIQRIGFANGMDAWLKS